MKKGERNIPLQVLIYFSRKRFQRSAKVFKWREIRMDEDLWSEETRTNGMFMRVNDWERTNDRRCKVRLAGSLP